MLEYPSSIIDSETAKDNPDWDLIENCIREMGDDINKLDYDDGEETLLSAIIYDHAEYYGKNLLRLTDLFLKHGYDVSANGCLNGGRCLHHLCEGWVDYHVLPVMEMFLDAGADTSVKNDDDWDVLRTIADQEYEWTDGLFKIANLFEALYTMVDSYVKNKPYIGIRGYEECIGGTLRKIEKVTLDRASIVDDVTYEGDFLGYLLFWIDDRPLIASVYPDFRIDPNVVESAVNRLDISNEVEVPILNGTFENVLFLEAYESLLVFKGTDQEDYYFRIWSDQCGPRMIDRRGIYDCGRMKGSNWEDEYGNRQR